MQLEAFVENTERLKIAGLRNAGGKGKPIIALHGWLDNAATFEKLAPLIQTDRPFYAIDLPGHGLSEHRPASCHYHLLDNILDVIAFHDALISQADPADQPEQESVTIIGHSLGGIIACLMAAAAPTRVDQLILLDSLGPLTDELEAILPQLRRAVEKAARIKSNVGVFPTLDMAVRARMSGIGKLSREAAECLVKRGIKEVSGGFSWRSDPKLLKPSFLRLSESQVEVIFAGIECPVKLLCGDQGYFADEQALQKRKRYFNKIDQYTIEGGHHFHLDGDVESAARYINAFI